MTNDIPCTHVALFASCFCISSFVTIYLSLALALALPRSLSLSPCALSLSHQAAATRTHARGHHHTLLGVTDGVSTHKNGLSKSIFHALHDAIKSGVDNPSVTFNLDRTIFCGPVYLVPKRILRNY